MRMLLRHKTNGQFGTHKKKHFLTIFSGTSHVSTQTKGKSPNGLNIIFVCAHIYFI